MANPVARESRLRNHEGKDLLRWVMTFCPGCQTAHPFTVEVFDGYTGRSGGEPEPVWQWDGNLEKPTFSPSMLAYSSVHRCPEPHVDVCEDPDTCGEKGHLILNGEGHNIPPEGERILGHNLPHTVEPAYGNCHSFLREGRWEFLSDSAHRLAGQTVDMVPLPDWLAGQEPS